ncbi:ABC transporter substrate-binding protein [Neorhizobium sp. JUb45]|uniref:ABC transporter substrate-binding protein n=1 Tax=Neorhizobium sp. JUb45 TaxID=2485113 RepID=UPI001045E87C|nr:ABC transporter substrate-binding protein [Neorhizobium sp. JUb45]TCR07127.1 glycine betaine/proline transport system substrate-binding protein [Neorhizobium sp. JUb45]
MIKTLLASAAVGLCFCVMTGTAQSADCGSVSIAEMNWASAGVAAHVDKIILENGYGCSVEIVPGDTMPTFTSMNEKSEPDIAPEFWVNSVRTPLDAAVKEGRLIQAAEILTDGAVEGWWIPKFLADAHPDIKTVDDALKHPELFPAPDDKTKAAIYNCPSGWSCQVSTANLYRAIGAGEKGFELVGTSSAADLDNSIANAFEKKIGWLGYYWAPTSIMGKYEMVKLSFGVPHNKMDWDTCTAVPDCPTAKVNSYPISQAFTIVTKGFADKAGIAMDYMKARKWSNDTVNSVLAWQRENNGSNESAARYFLKENEDVWTKWVTFNVAEKVRAAL